MAVELVVALARKDDEARPALGLGSSAIHDATEFATAEQGLLADTSVQPEDLAPVATTGSADDIVDGTLKKTFSATEKAKLGALPDNAALELSLGNKVNAAEKSAANGVATLDVDSKVPAVQLPIGSTVQGYSANLATLSVVTPLAAGTSMLAMASASDVRDFLDTPPYVATRAALKALDTTKDTTVILKEDGREGLFDWTPGNFSTQIAADTEEGAYIKANAIAAASGAWVRVFDDGVSPTWFGGKGTGAVLDTLAFKNAAIVAMAAGFPLDLGSKKWLVQDGLWPGYSADEMRTVVLVNAVTLSVVGEGAQILFDGNTVADYATIFRCINGGSIRLTGVTLDYSKPPFTQGFVLSKTATKARFQIDTPSFGVPTWATVQRIAVYEEDTNNYIKTALEVSGPVFDKPFTFVSTGVYDVDFTSDTASLANLSVFETCVLYHKVNGYYFVDASDGSLFVDDCEVWAVAGMAFSGSYVKDVHIGEGVRIRPKPGTVRKIATTSDGIHFNGISGQCYIAPELIAGTSDDACNVNVPMGKVALVTPGAPYNTVIHDTFLYVNVLPGRTPIAGDYLFGIGTDGSQISLGKVLQVSTAAPASVSNPAIRMNQVLPAALVLNSKVGNYRWVCSPYYAPKQVRNVRGGGAVIRGIGSTIRGNYVDITGPAVSIVAFWSLYDEGPISQNIDVDVYARRCGKAQVAVTGVIRVDALTLAGSAQAPAAVMIGGSITAIIEDCRPGAVWATSFDSTHFDITERNTNYDPWINAAVPQPTATGYFKFCNNCVIDWQHIGSADATLYFDTCARVNLPPSNSKVVYVGTGYSTIVQDITVSGGGNVGGAGGAVDLRSNAGTHSTKPMARIKGILSAYQAGIDEQQGGIAIQTRPVNASTQALIDRLQVLDNGIVKVMSSAWNGGHFQIGDYHLFADALNRFRYKTSTPLSDPDGVMFWTDNLSFKANGLFGYVQTPDGKIRQWGKVAASGAVDINITFPVAFPNVFEGALVTANENPGVDAFIASYDGPSLSAMNIRRRKVAAAGAVTATLFSVSWEVWGY